MTCGNWRLGVEIGRGAFGVVHHALGPDGESVAIRVCRRADIGDESYAREIRGAKLYGTIPRCEGLLYMREIVETDWGFYAVFDLADDEFGGVLESTGNYRPKTLAKVIAGEKALRLEECIGLAISLARGLMVLQRHHLLHRDIKPGNVLYVGGRAVLADPGLLIEEAEAASLVGTPGYVPPERFTDSASDVYSLGLTLKAASFGRQVDDLGKGPAMEADTGAACFPAWWRILNKATDPVASRRYRSAKALAKDLCLLRYWMMASELFRGRFLVVAIVVLSVVAVLCSWIFMSKSNYDDFVSRADQERKSVAEKALADFVDKRVAEDMPDIRRGIKEAYLSTLNMMRDELADKKKEIAEFEDQIAESEKDIKEAEEAGDRSRKAAIEYNLRHKKKLLGFAQKRVAELERDIPAWEKKISTFEEKHK